MLTILMNQLKIEFLLFLLPVICIWIFVIHFAKISPLPCAFSPFNFTIIPDVFHGAQLSPIKVMLSSALGIVFFTNGFF